MTGRSFAIFLVAVAAALAAALWLYGAGAESVERGAEALPAKDDATPASPPTGPVDHRLELEAPDGAHPVIWVRKGEKVPVRTEAGGGRVVEVLGRSTEFGSPTVLGVVETSGRWAGISTPALPNDTLGWVRLDARRLRASGTQRSIEVDLSERRAVLRDGDEELRSFAVTIGAPGAETPTGHFTVTDTFRGGLNPVYGCCAVALSAIQPSVPSGWLGGNRIAFHGNGTGGPLGVAASNGCLRADDEDVDALVSRVGLGTPVFIRK